MVKQARLSTKGVITPGVQHIYIGSEEVGSIIRDDKGVVFTFSPVSRGSLFKVHNIHVDGVWHISFHLEK